MAARFSLALLVLYFALLPHRAAAVDYQRLHVQSFTLASDTATPRIETPFHVTLTIRVREKVSQLENVYLPAFSGAEELGDERETTQDASGTLYRETLILVAHSRGPIAIGSAYLDAIDARDGKPKRFISNSLSVTAVGGPLLDVWQPIRAAVMLVLEIAFLVVAVFVVVAIFRRPRRAPPEPQPQPVPEPLPPAQTPEDAVRAAVDDLRVRRNRAAVLNVRSALWTMTGATSGETLGDVLQRCGSRDGRFRGLLVAVERATFVEDAYLDEAVSRVLSESERSL